MNLLIDSQFMQWTHHSKSFFLFTSLLTAIISMIYLAVGKGTPLKRVFLQLVVEANQHFPQSSYPDFFHNATSNFSFLSSVLHLYMFCPTNQPSFIVVKKLKFFGSVVKKLIATQRVIWQNWKQTHQSRNNWKCLANYWCSNTQINAWFNYSLPTRNF